MHDLVLPTHNNYLRAMLQMNGWNLHTEINTTLRVHLKKLLIDSKLDHAKVSRYSTPVLLLCHCPLT